jgi:hypothetical protein
MCNNYTWIKELHEAGSNIKAKPTCQEIDFSLELCPACIMRAFQAGYLVIKENEVI